MAWIAVVTNAGRGLLDQFAAGGHTLNIDGATVGSGVVAEANLRIQTALTDEEDAASIISSEAFSGGNKYKVQVGPAEEAAYTAHQIGIWAHIDSGTTTLLLLAQDAGNGVSVPLKSVSPSFAFGLYLTLAVDNTGRLTVNIDESAYVTVGTMNAAIEVAIEAARPGLAGNAKRGLVGPANYLANGLILQATTERPGLMSAADRAKLIASEALVFSVGSGLTQTPGFHNSIYRGKNLGSSVTEAQWDAIDAGTFDDLFIGDYWEIDGTTWRIAAFDYWRIGNDTHIKHHAVIVPDSVLIASCAMNGAMTSDGAYAGSDFYTGNNGNTGKATAQSMIEAAFGSDHILGITRYLTTATSNGAASAWSGINCKVELMNECMVFGSSVNGTKDINNKNYNVGTDNSQLPLFRHDHAKIANGSSWWLRDVSDARGFSRVANIGEADVMLANTTAGIRPAFAIKA